MRSGVALRATSACLGAFLSCTLAQQVMGQRVVLPSRYLRATKWNVAKAIERLESTLKWRREFGLYTHTPEYLEPEVCMSTSPPYTDHRQSFLLKFVTGKQILFGYDSQNRPALYMFPSRQNTETSDRQIQQVVWVLERAADLMAPGTEWVCHQSRPHQYLSYLFIIEPWRS